MKHPIAIVVAYDQNYAIGAHGDLPWGRKLPADLTQFTKITTGCSIIMGRKTFESIGSRPLPDRENIVISRTPTGVSTVLTAINLASALALSRYPVCIIGGGQIYQEALDIATLVYATEVHHTFSKTDTFFPKLNSSWHEISRIHHPKDEMNVYPFDFVTYQRS